MAVQVKLHVITNQRGSGALIATFGYTTTFKTMTKKNVLITGCSSGGIGSSLAKEYHTQGLRVFATARNPGTMTDLQSMGIECFELDVTNANSIHNVCDQVSQLTGGTLDILVNNAGQSYSIPFTDNDIEEVKAMFDTNIFGVMRVTQTFIPLLIASGFGRIVNIGSLSAIIPIPFGAAYAASKGALHSFGHSLATELEPFNVKVITIITGGVKSNIGRRNLGLPPNSIYYPMNEDFITKRQGMSQRNAMMTADYARSVVAATLKTRPKMWVWQGHFSRITWLIDTLLPKSFWGLVVPRFFGLDKFKRFLQERRKND